MEQSHEDRPNEVDGERKHGGARGQRVQKHIELAEAQGIEHLAFQRGAQRTLYRSSRTPANPRAPVAEDVELPGPEVCRCS